jgi:hypothetical protein
MRHQHRNLRFIQQQLQASQREIPLSDFGKSFLGQREGSGFSATDWTTL